MSGFFDDYIVRALKATERYLLKKWRKPIGLLIILIIVAGCFFFLIQQAVPAFKPGENQWILYCLLAVTAILWLCFKYRNRLVKKRVKFGVLLHADNRSREEVNRILLPILDELREEISEVKFINIDSSPFQTVAGAEAFLRKNDDGLNQILFLKATIAQDAGENKFLVEEAVFCTRDIPLEFYVFGERVNIRDEVAFRSQNEWGFSMANELYGASNLRGNIKDVVYYYLGLSSVCTERAELGLQILKRLFKPSDQILDREAADDKVRIRLNKKFYKSSRLAKILSLLCRLNFNKYHNEKRDPHSIIAFLKEYVELLDESTDAFEIYVSLARYSYDVGNIQDARLYTRRMESIRPDSYLVHLNNGFFGMIDRSVDTVVGNYKALCKYIEERQKQNKKIDYNSDDVISFLQKQEADYPESITLLRYGIAIQRFYSDGTASAKGVEMLNDLNGRTEKLMKYRLLNLHVKSLLKKKEKRIVAKRKSKVT